jgi:hypothetical protein
VRGAWTGSTSAAAVRRSYRVLECCPVSAEAQLAYAALADLFDGVPDDVLAELPGPQRRAVEVALLREEPDVEGSLPRAVAVGLLGVLRVLSRSSPVVVAVDDAQCSIGPQRELSRSLCAA